MKICAHLSLALLSSTLAFGAGSKPVRHSYDVNSGSFAQYFGAPQRGKIEFASGIWQWSGNASDVFELRYPDSTRSWQCPFISDDPLNTPLVAATGDCNFSDAVCVRSKDTGGKEQGVLGAYQPCWAGAYRIQINQAFDNISVETPIGVDGQGLTSLLVHEFGHASSKEFRDTHLSAPDRSCAMEPSATIVSMLGEMLCDEDMDSSNSFEYTLGEWYPPFTGSGTPWTTFSPGLYWSIDAWGGFEATEGDMGGGLTLTYARSHAVGISQRRSTAFDNTNRQFVELQTRLPGENVAVVLNGVSMDVKAIIGGTTRVVASRVGGGIAIANNGVVVIAVLLGGNRPATAGPPGDLLVLANHVGTLDLPWTFVSRQATGLRLPPAVACGGDRCSVWFVPPGVTESAAVDFYDLSMSGVGPVANLFSSKIIVSDNSLPYTPAVPFSAKALFDFQSSQFVHIGFSSAGPYARYVLVPEGSASPELYAVDPGGIYSPMGADLIGGVLNVPY